VRYFNNKKILKCISLSDYGRNKCSIFRVYRSYNELKKMSIKHVVLIHHPLQPIPVLNLIKTVITPYNPYLY